MDIARRADGIALVVGKLQQELAEARRKNAVLRHFELRVVEGVEEVGTKFEAMTFRDVEGLEDRKIPVIDAGATERIGRNRIIIGIEREERGIKEVTGLARIKPLEFCGSSWCKVGHAEAGEVQRHTGLERSDPAQLPATDHRIRDA